MSIRTERTPRTRAVATASFVAALTFVTACSSGDDTATPDDTTTAPSDVTTASTDTTGSTEPVIDPGDGGDYAPEIDPANFVDVIDNPYWPMTPGSTWQYEGLVDGETEYIEVTVTDERREVMGVSTIVVRDTVTNADGELVEDTSDWFAQDVDGNVWYFGEETAEYEDGEVVSTEGAWEAGVDGAQPGIVMPADPAVGDAYRQEFLVGEAEDLAEVLEVDASESVPAGDYADLVVTEEWTPLTPDAVEEKYYAPGVGLVLEVHVQGGEGRVELVSFTPGS